MLAAANVAAALVDLVAVTLPFLTAIALTVMNAAAAVMGRQPLLSAVMPS